MNLSIDDLKKHLADPKFQAYAEPVLKQKATARGATATAMPWGLLFSMAEELLNLLAQWLAGPPAPVPPAPAP